MHEECATHLNDLRENYLGQKVIWDLSIGLTHKNHSTPYDKGIQSESQTTKAKPLVDSTKMLNYKHFFQTKKPKLKVLTLDPPRCPGTEVIGSMVIGSMAYVSPTYKY